MRMFMLIITLFLFFWVTFFEECVLIGNDHWNRTEVVSLGISKNLILPMGTQYADYLHDESRQMGQAESISFPTSEEEMCEIMRIMSARETDVTIQGSLTGLAAGAVPNGGHIMNVQKMNRVLGMRIGKEGKLFDPHLVFDRRLRNDSCRRDIDAANQKTLVDRLFKDRKDGIGDHLDGRCGIF